MLRFVYVIFMRIGSILHFVPKMRWYARHRDRYSEEDCHALTQDMMHRVAKTARTSTDAYGTENLPPEGGYILFSNHQGKYDALGILLNHPRPCRILMDKKRSEMPIANELIDLVQGKRLDKSDIRQQVTCIREIAAEVRDGKVYLIFPEGGYAKDQTNRMADFHGGCFRAAIQSACPIVPVALIDSYKPFGGKTGNRPFTRVHTEVHFLPPIPYEAYRGMSSASISRMVQARIADCMEERLGAPMWDRQSV